MVDAMVLATQQWLNATYGSDSRYNTIAEDGYTGWNTIFALTRALQIELGIQNTADNFGPTSQALYAQNPLQPTVGMSNKFAILQGALWCKGYNPGHFVSLDNHFDQSVANAVISMKEDAGKALPDAVVSVNFMKALLSMNQFQIIPGSGGDSNVRSFQQEMNRDFETYVGIIPCDGLYNRDTNKAAILVLQALEGMPASVANGNFGTGTKTYCPSIPYSGDQSSYTGSTYSASAIVAFTRLLNFCLYVNGFGNGNFGSGFSANSVSSFQQLCSLPQTGVANLATWMSLLISYGDNTRKGAACDTRFEITIPRLGILKANSYSIVGRYITHGIIDGEDKALQDGELARILAAGLSVFPIFQTSGSSLSYFTAAQGAADAAALAAAGAEFDIPLNTVIYVAVDFDALDADVTTKILPYFQSLHQAAGDEYQIGIYGARNVCSRVSAAGYAVNSFVSDMSSGFSGNMGYRLPSNWGFDQISNLTITSGSHSLEIDNDITSVNAAEFNSIYPTTPDNPSPDITNAVNAPRHARVNLSTTAIPVYNARQNADAANRIGQINPNEIYIRQDGAEFGGSPIPASSYTYEIYFKNSAGNIVVGFIHASDSWGSDILYPWASQQKEFTDYNSTGSTLTGATTTTINGSSYAVFTLKQDLAWCHDDGMMSPLKAGTKIALKQGAGNTDAPMGAIRILFMLANYWGDGSFWFPFHAAGQQVNGYVDLGLQYGSTPSARPIW
jgi:peptidoglycan hydrolase-like protein with peptidoglycan-binding domain